MGDKSKMAKERYYLGINLGFNSSACIFSNKRGLIAAVSQERMNGEKNTKKFPLKALIECIKIAEGGGIISTFECIGISHYQFIRSADIFNTLSDEEKNVLCKDMKPGPSWQVFIFNLLHKVNIYVKNVVRVEHHTAHKNSAMVFHGEPTKDAIFMTADGFGDGISGRISLDSGDVLSTMGIGNSIGLIYQFTTGALGYKEHHHEGKITGLAAFGKSLYYTNYINLFDNVNFSPRTDNINDTLLKLDEYEQTFVDISSIENFDIFLRLKKTVYAMVKELLDAGAKPEDIAASVQEFAELQMCDWLLRTMERYDNILGNNTYDLYLAGGLFANVKLNQALHELYFVDHIYVAPCMGDEGTAVGAAYQVMRDAEGGRKLKAMEGPQTALIGTQHEINKDDVIRILKVCADNGDKFITSKFADGGLTHYIAKQLSKQKIVCLYRGRMEFGPRALCNRSILYHCEDASVNKWLNEKLSRTEFMPFAPFCKAEHLKDLFFAGKGAEQTAQYMTITFDCTEEFIINYPAACHVDNTARPQLVTQESNPFAYDILEEYFKLTGRKALINTSFNLHNNPIIESPEVAVSSWLTSGTDILVLGNVVIERVK